MLGNVWEWCQNAAKNQDDWPELYPYTSEPAVDPVLGRGSYRIRRGGSWLGAPRDGRAASRDADERSNSNDFVGFRLAGGQVSAPSLPAGERDASMPRRKSKPARAAKPPKPAKKKDA
jgi:hypothetical protein